MKRDRDFESSANPTSKRLSRKQASKLDYCSSSIFLWFVSDSWKAGVIDWLIAGDGSSDGQTKELVRQVADHYSARGNQTREQREASPIIHLKKLNNWV